MPNDSSKQIHQKTEANAPQKWGAVVGVVLGLLAFLVPQFMVGVLYSLLKGDANTVPEADRLYMYAASSLLTLLLISLLLQRYKASLSGFFGRFKGGYIAYALAALPVYMVLSMLFHGLMTMISPGFDPDQAQDIGFTADQSGVGLIIVFISLVVIPPVVEEVLFRGFVFRGFLKSLNPVVAAILTSAIFGLAHGQWNVGVDTFALSLALCYLAYKTNSLWPSILLHSLKNLIAFILVFVITPEQLQLLWQQLL